MSDDGARVEFVSTADNLSTQDSNNGDNVFVRDSASNTTTLVNHAPGQNAPQGVTSGASLSGDGRWATFDTNATLTPPGVENGAVSDVFRYDLAVTGGPAPASVAPPAPAPTPAPAPAPSPRPDNCDAGANPSLPDRDKDGISDACDTSDASVPPVIGKTVIARVVSGKVFFRPPAATRSRREAHAAQAPAGFRPVKGAEVIPVGSTVDAVRGRLALTSVAVASSAGETQRTQEADFYQGIFQVRQARVRRPVTDLFVRSPTFRRVCGAPEGLLPQGPVPGLPGSRRLRSCGATGTGASARSGATARQRCAAPSG